MPAAKVRRGGVNDRKEVGNGKIKGLTQSVLLGDWLRKENSISETQEQQSKIEKDVWVGSDDRSLGGRIQNVKRMKRKVQKALIGRREGGREKNTPTNYHH